ncbi:MAG: hypothetical protein C0520_15400 [Sphingopyxis sp.]|nr:hypothetical protein [Sphingopyxis sp.]
MNRFSNIVFAATALVASVADASPTFAADRASDGYHWEYTPGPRGTARRVADRVAKPITMAREAGHWRLGFGPRSTPTWVPADRQAPVEQMADAMPMPKAS